MTATEQFIKDAIEGGWRYEGIGGTYYDHRTTKTNHKRKVHQ